MIIPPIRWGDILLRTEDERSVILTEREQYILLMLLSLAHMNSEQFIADYTTPDAADIHQFLDETMNSLFTEDIPPLTVLLNVDLFTINATPLAGAGALTYNASATLPFGYSMSNANTTLFGMEQPVWLLAGEYDYHGWSSFTSFGGNTDVAITDGASVIDTIVSNVNQSGTFGVRIHSTGTFTIPSTGMYKIVAANNGTGAGAGRQANWISHHIRKTS